GVPVPSALPLRERNLPLAATRAELGRRCPLGRLSPRGRAAVMRLVLARLGQSVVVLLVISYVSYVLMGLMPGDPIDLMVGADPTVSAADVERLRALHGLDRPIHERY